MPFSICDMLKPASWCQTEGHSSGFRQGWWRGRRAFTIVELLVAFAVLALLVTILLSAFTNFSQVTTTANRQLELEKQSRTIFDRMVFDLGAAVTSGNVRVGFKKNEALAGGTASRNDALVFLTDAKTPSTDGRLAKIGYAVGPYTDRSRNDMELQTVLRYVQPFEWADDTTEIAISDARYAQPIAPGIIRFEFSFVMQDGSIVAAPPTATSDSDQMRAFYDDLAAVVCTVATLDEDTLQKMSENERKALADTFADAVNGKTPLETWQATSLTSFPKPVAQGVRFHQRSFQLR